LGRGPPHFFSFGGHGAGLRLSHFEKSGDKSAVSTSCKEIASGLQFLAWFRFEKKKERAANAEEEDHKNKNKNVDVLATATPGFLPPKDTVKNSLIHTNPSLIPPPP
jgi:hypothetical protein